MVDAVAPKLEYYVTASRRLWCLRKKANRPKGWLAFAIMGNGQFAAGLVLLFLPRGIALFQECRHPLFGVFGGA